MKKIKIMISSVISGLEAERDALKEAFLNIDFVELIGAKPYNSMATSASSAFATIEMAKECDVYVLILSERYGMKILGDKSATEAEFDAAIKDDPTKIMVFLKESTTTIEPEQQQFIEKVSNYYSGYFRPEFKNSHQLMEMVKDSFSNWLIDRAQLNRKMTYIDHFVRISKNILPAENAKVYYRITEDYVEFDYYYNKKTYSIDFQYTQILKDFWKCVNDLQLSCDEWGKE